MSVELSVVTPTRDLAPVLARCLDAIAHQSLDPARYEVVVVDDGSSDETSAVVEAARRRAGCAIRLFRRPERGGIPAARNLAVREARGEIIVFVDSDELAPPAFLAAHLDCHRRHGHHILCRGPVIVTDSVDRPFEKRSGLLDLSTAYFDTDNASVRREHLLRAGLFDETFSPYGWEGLDLGFRLKAIGLRRVFRRDAAIYHYRPEVSSAALPALLAKEEERAATALRFIRKTPTLEARLATCATPVHFWMNAVQRGFGVFHVGNAVPWVARLHRWGFPGIARVVLAGVLRSRYFDCLRCPRREPGRPEAPSSTMDISVIIPTYNNRAVLERALQALLSQTFPADRYEIVIVDDGSTDGTAEMVTGLRGTVAMQYLPRPHGGRASTRNAGARAARGRILLFLDSDFFAAPGLLAAHHGHYPPDARGIAIQGASRTHPDALMTPFMRAREFYLEVPPGPPGRISLFRVSTRNLSLLAADFAAAGGFDEAFGGYGWEDIELAWRLKGRGVRFSFEPAAGGDHYQVQDLEGLRRKMREGGRSAVYFWQQHRRSWWLGVRLEIAPILLPFKWLVYRTPLITAPVRAVLRVAEAHEWRPVLSECTNHLAWEAYYEGVFGALRRERQARRAAEKQDGGPTETPARPAETRARGAEPRAAAPSARDHAAR